MKQYPGFTWEELCDGDLSEAVGVSSDVLEILKITVGQICRREPHATDILLIGQASKKTGIDQAQFLVRDRSLKMDTLDHYMVVITNGNAKVFKGAFDVYMKRSIRKGGGGDGCTR